MSTNITPFSSDCEHVLRALPMFDMTVKYTCDRCGGVQDITTEALTGASYDTVVVELLAEFGGTIGKPVPFGLPPVADEDEEFGEPRRWEYPVGGVLNKVYRDHEDIALNHLGGADIQFIEYLDAWIDKGLADGTLTIEKGARYREAIVTRCAELGEVPHVREHIAALKLKPGDVLALIAPSDSTILMRQLATETTRYLDYWKIKGVAVAVYPPGTEIRVLEGAAAEVPDKVRQFVEERIAAGIMTQEQFRTMLQREIIAQGRW